MRLTVTICLLLAAWPGTAQQPAVRSATPPKAVNNVLLKCKVGEPVQPAPLNEGQAAAKHPLYIVDNVLFEPEAVKKIDPADIVSITVLKDAASVNMLCNRNAGGIVIITTRKKFAAEFTIIDTNGKAPVAGATVKITSVAGKKMSFFTSNSTGALQAHGLVEGEAYDVMVSSVGYNTVALRYTHLPNLPVQQIPMTPNEIIEREVIVVSSKTRRRGCPAPAVYSIKDISPVKEKEEMLPENRFVVFPNPLPRGNNVTIDMTSAEQQAAMIRIYGRDGKLVWEQSVQTVKGPNRFYVNTDSRWAAGVYFLQMISRGDAVKTSQLLIH